MVFSSNSKIAVIISLYESILDQLSDLDDTDDVADNVCELFVLIIRDILSTKFFAMHADKILIFDTAEDRNNYVEGCGGFEDLLYDFPDDPCKEISSEEFWELAENYTDLNLYTPDEYNGIVYFQT